MDGGRRIVQHWRQRRLNDSEYVRALMGNGGVLTCQSMHRLIIHGKGDVCWMEGCEEVGSSRVVVTVTAAERGSGKVHETAGSCLKNVAKKKRREKTKENDKEEERDETS